MQERFRKWTQNPIAGAFLISILFALILFPYWWLADQWSQSVLSDPSTQFTFTSTTFLLILAIIDSAFLIRYYQIRQKNELRCAGEQVRIGAENYRSLIENAPFPIVITTYADNTILVINKEAAHLFSLNPEERIGKPVSYQFIDSVKQKTISDALAQKNRIADLEVSFEKENGQIMHASLSANIIDYLGEKAVFTAFVDISDRVELEKEIIKREEKFSTVFHEVPNPLLIISENGIIVDMNQGSEKYFGHLKDEYIGKKLEYFHFFPDINSSSFSNDRKEEQTPNETTILLPNGERRFVILHIQPVVIQDAPHILIIIQDIHEIKRAQNAISQANNQLLILNSITRHDILNRIMAVMSYCELLLTSVTTDPAKTWVKNILKSGEDIEVLVDFTRQYQDLGVNPPRWQRVEKVIQNRSISSLITQITLILPKDSYELYIDPMFEKVLYNLVDNSIRHGGHVTEITLSYEKKDTYLILRYTDNGVGIAPDDKKKIFSKGFGKNTGLGLFLIREILSLTGISITEHGEQGKGVCFDMIIPAGTYRNYKKMENNSGQHKL